MPSADNSHQEFPVDPVDAASQIVRDAEAFEFERHERLEQLKDKSDRAYILALMGTFCVIDGYIGNRISNAHFMPEWGHVDDVVRYLSAGLGVVGAIGLTGAGVYFAATRLSRKQEE